MKKNDHDKIRSRIIHFFDFLVIASRYYLYNMARYDDSYKFRYADILIYYHSYSSLTEDRSYYKPSDS